MVSNERNEQKNGGFTFLVTNHRKYTSKVERAGYETQSIPLDVKESDRVTWRYLPVIYLRKKKKLEDEQQLEEVTVTATKVKFYHKNDTLVYNADAFQLSEGSMLDALVKQLPGAELKMDVNLKKQYNIGWLGNVDAGMANDDLYMARLFALRSTDHSQLAIFSNFNNMNDGGTPTQGSDWTPEKLPMSRLTTKKVGVNLNVDDRLNRFRLRSNADFTHYDNHEETNTYRTNFLSAGDTYERSQNVAKYCNLYFNLNNNLTLTPGGRDSKSYMYIDQKANHSRRKQHASFLSALMSESWENHEELWKQLFPISTGDLHKYLINRVENKSQSDLESWFASMTYFGSFKVNEAGDNLDISVGGEVFDKTDEGFSNYRLSYAQDNLAGSNDYRRYYTPWASNGYGYNVGVRYSKSWTD